MGSFPKISIGLPVYNGENHLAEAIDSLLCQTYIDFELIISDNASTDSTQKLCQEYAARDQRIRYFRYDVNKGAAWNFNNTFHLAEGEYFKWAAHDDTHHPEFLEKCLHILESKPEVVLCFARTLFIDDVGENLNEYIYPLDLYHASKRDRYRHFANGGHIVHEIFGVIRMNILRQTPLVSGYLGSDLVLLSVLSLRGPFFQIPEILFYHREHELRAMLNPQGANDKTEWFDASKKGSVTFPFWRRMYENAKNISSDKSLNSRERLLFLYDLLRVARWNKAAHLKEISFNVKRIFRK